MSCHDGKRKITPFFNAMGQKVPSGDDDDDDDTGNAVELRNNTHSVHPLLHPQRTGANCIDGGAR